MSPSPSSHAQSDALKSETSLSTRPVNDASTDAIDEDAPSNPNPKPARKGIRFWLIVLAICVSLFLSALEYTGVSTALPTIVHDLHGEDFVWVAAAYSLASTAFLPMTGGCAQIFGRRSTMLGSLALFALGSALCGAAKNMNWLIAARAVQGAGGGGIQAITSIILSDMVTLQERPAYNGLIGLTWGFASGIGPVVGGALATHGAWRWLFYLNLPLTGVAAALVIMFLQLKTPEGSLREKLDRMDWIGNMIIIASSSSTVIALTWGGVNFPWASAHVLVPLIVGIAGMGFFLFYEARFAKNPIVPFSLISNRTSLSGYLQTFFAPVVMVAMTYFMPLYFQACKGASPVRAGVEFFGLALSLGPVLLATGASIAITKRYRPQLWFGWALFMLGMGVLSTLHADSPLSRAVGFEALIGIGGGILYATTYFPVLAPLPAKSNAHALAFFAFCRYFAGVWGVSIGTAILQTQLSHHLTADFLAQFPQGVAVAYSIVPAIPTFSPTIQAEVKEAFASSILVIWQVMVGVSAMGLLVSLFMKGLPLHTEVDREWALEEKAASKSESEEKAV